MAKAKSTDAETIVTSAPDATKEPSLPAPDATKKPSLSSRAVATVAPKFRVVGQVTRPLLKQAAGQTVYFTVLSKVYQGKPIKGSKIEKAAMLVNVRNLAEGAGNGEMQYIVPAILWNVDDDGELSGVFVENYPDHSYVGKSFAIYKHPIEPGKRYSPLEVVEIEVVE